MFLQGVEEKILFSNVVDVWTLFVIMASAESAGNNIGLVEGAEGMNAESCEEYIESDFFSDNRYNCLNHGSGNHLMDLMTKSCG